MTNETDNYEARLAAIEARNARVADDKAWEGSWARRLLIALTTYLIVLAYNTAIGLDVPWLTAVVPTAGFLLSTVTFKFLKQRWIQRRIATQI